MFSSKKIEDEIERVCRETGDAEYLSYLLKKNKTFNVAATIYVCNTSQFPMRATYTWGFPEVIWYIY